MKAVLIDAYDSFVYIIEQYLAELGADPTVVRSAAENADLVRELQPDVLVLGPGPGHPLDSGHVELVREFAPYIGVSYDRRLGDSARFSRAEGEDVGGPSFVVGVRTWF